MDQATSDNLYVAGLPSGVTELTVKQIFGTYGTVTQCRVLQGGAGKCSALVRFATAQDAGLVVSMSGTVLPGFAEPVQIKYAASGDGKAQRHPTNWGSGGGSGAGGGGAGTPMMQGPSPSDNLFVSGLPEAIDSDSLRQIFSTYGEVVQCRVPVKALGNGKVAALIRYTSVMEATQIKDSLNGSIPSGLTEPVSIDYAGPPGGRNDEMISMIVKGFEACGCMPGGHGFSNEEGTLYIAGLPPDTSDLHLYRLFAPFGPIAPKGVHAVLNPDMSCRGIGFVNFLHGESAQRAIQTINGTQLPDMTTLKVAVKTKKGQQQTPP